jgi:hypothetical protein
LVILIISAEVKRSCRYRASPFPNKGARMDRVEELEQLCSTVYLAILDCVNGKAFPVTLLDKLDNAASGLPLDYEEYYEEG